MGYFLVKQPEPVHRWRVSFAAGVLRVSSKLGSSHRTLSTPVEAYAPPCKASILPFRRGQTSWSAFQPVSISALHFAAFGPSSTVRYVQPGPGEWQCRRVWALRLLMFVDSRFRGNDGGGPRRRVGAVGAKQRP